MVLGFSKHSNNITMALSFPQHSINIGESGPVETLLIKQKYFETCFIYHNKLQAGKSVHISMIYKPIKQICLLKYIQNMIMF